MTVTLSDLAAEVVKDGVVDAKEAALLRERIFADGKIDREEADVLFRINDAVSGKANDAAWQQLFVQALTAHVLGDATTPGDIDADEATYLVSKMQGDGKVDSAERALLVNLMKKAKSAPESFQDFVLKTMKTAILADGVIDRDEVEQLRVVVYGSGGGGGKGVDRKEADFLFELNTATSGKSNHPSWKDLFVEAVGGHLLEDATSPGTIDEQEAAWLVRQIDGDSQVDANERALLAHLKASAKGMPGVLKEKMTALGI